jgi:carboxyl-terminal processing protease
LAFSATPVRAGEAAKPKDKSEEDYESWANQPKDKFGNGAQVFQQAKAQLLKGYYREDITEDDLYRAAVQGMLHYVDPKMHAHNRLISPSEFSEMQTDLKGELVGIGVQIKFDEASGIVDVIGVLAGSPAEKADLREGDKLLTIDGKSFKGLQLRDVVYAIRGKEGESVKLEFLRDAQLQTKVVTRERIKIELVNREKLPNDIELISIHSFSDPTPAMVKKALLDAAADQPKGLIVDLRDDKGGLLDKSVETAELFLPKGKVVTQVVHRGGKTEVMTSKSDPVLKPLPTVVLINENSMSSAELVAAALHEGLSAPLIGSKTFGKWSAQTIEELSNHFVMKYTTAMFQTPSGKSYEGEGMPADIEVPMDPEILDRVHPRDPAGHLAADVQLRAAHSLLRMRP